MSIGTNVAEKANLIWAIADNLTGSFKPSEYRLVILPLTVIRRFDCILEKTHDKVRALYEKKQKEGKFLGSYDDELYKITGHCFYNTSEFTMTSLLENSAQIYNNLSDYLEGFSSNVKDIISKFKFNANIDTMNEKNILYHVLEEFVGDKADFSPEKISNIEMGYVFEEIIRKFSEQDNEDAGQHYTPREVIELMCQILFCNDEDVIENNKIQKSLYDPACGTGGMLTVAGEYLKNINSNVTLDCYGQEIQDETYAICKADILIKSSLENENASDNIYCGNTLSEDQLPITFDYVLSNPPFGRPWKNEEKAVEKENAKGENGRFAAGLPASSDSQMLFMQAVFSKLDKEHGKGAVIHNGSPLFSGDAGSGPSEIRRYVLEHDILEAIIALPNDIFYNTGIATYIWVFNRNKDKKRQGKVQLINANALFEKRRKALGNKRNDISDKDIAKIVKEYKNFKPTELSKVFDTEDFGYNKITVERPLLDEKGKPVEKKGKVQADSNKRDTENIPLKQDIHEYFEKEVKPYAPDAWIDESKTKIGYEIPFTRYFYKYEAPKKADVVKKEILSLEAEAQDALKDVFGE